MSGNIIGIDLGGTRLRIGHMSLDKVRSAVVSRDAFLNMELDGISRAYVADVLPDGSPKERLSELVCKYAREYGIECDVAAIGIGAPSGFNDAKDTITWTGNIPCLYDVPIVSQLKDVFGAGTAVVLDGDTVMHMQHDVLALGNERDVLSYGIYFGTGVGGAVAVNGCVFDGANGKAGCIGHVPQLGNDETCMCGRIGCVESLLGGKHLASLAHRYGVDINDIFNAAEADDELVRELDEFVEAMSRVAAGVLNMLDPDLLVIGGGIPSMSGFPKDKFEELVLGHALVKELNSLEYGMSGHESGIVGSIIAAYRKMSCL